MKTFKWTEKNDYLDYGYFSGEDLTSEMIQQCFDLDKKFFKEEYLYNEEKVRNWLRTHNEMCSVLYSPKENKVIAYCFYLFISDEAFQLYKENKLSFFTLGERFLVKPQHDEKVNLFCLSDACEPGWDYVKMHRIMNEYNVYNLYEMAIKKNIKVENVCIDVVCEYDKKLAKQFNITECVKTNHNSEFVWGKFDPEKTWTYCKYSKPLIEAYKK